jgi:hypothetical protein
MRADLKEIAGKGGLPAPVIPGRSVVSSPIESFLVSAVTMVVPGRVSDPLKLASENVSV